MQGAGPLKHIAPVEGKLVSLAIVFEMLGANYWVLLGSFNDPPPDFLLLFARQREEFQVGF